MVKKGFFQNSDANQVKFRCENSCISSPYNSLHLPTFAGFSTDSKTLNPFRFQKYMPLLGKLGRNR